MKKMLFVILLSLMVVACSPEGNEPAANVELEEMPTAEIWPTKPEIMDDEDKEGVVADETSPEDEEQDVVYSDPVAPVSVDLGAITPSPIDSSSEPRVMPAPGVPSNPVPASLTELVDEMVRDLSGRLGVAENAINVISWEEVVWRDGSIGCPQPDMMYTMALVDGHRVVLESGGDVYQYHTRGVHNFILCENPQE